MESPTEKKKKVRVLLFFHTNSTYGISNPISNRSQVDRMQSVTHARTHARTGPNQFASSTFRSLGHKYGCTLEQISAHTFKKEMKLHELVG